jgi:hypothetical protein
VGEVGRAGGGADAGRSGPVAGDADQRVRLSHTYQGCKTVGGGGRELHTSFPSTMQLNTPNRSCGSAITYTVSVFI